MAEQPSRKRPIARRAVMVMAAVVLLASAYVGAWVLLPQAANRRWIDWTAVSMLEETVFAPITVYSAEQWPGADWLNAAWGAVNGSALLETDET